MKAYKLCWVETDGRLVSCSTCGAGEVGYALGDPAVPHLDCGPLAAFETLDQVRDFLEIIRFKREAPYAVFLCEVDAVEPRANEHGYILWDQSGIGVEGINLPRGTIFCARIMLIEEIFPPWASVRRLRSEPVL